MLSDSVLDTLFRAARTHNAWQQRAVSDADLRSIYDLMKWGPTAANCQPCRIVWVRTTAAKEKLRAALSPANVDKSMAAPVTAIVAYDLDFFEHLPRIYPQADARSWYAGKPEVAERAAFQSGSLQA